MSKAKAILRFSTNKDVIFDFKLREIPLAITKSASQFVAGTLGRSSDFQINPLAAEQSGVAKLQRAALDERIEAEALDQLKEVQERAYREAYEVGLSEGRETGFSEEKSKLGERLGRLDEILAEFENMKGKLAADHEAHFIHLIFDLASRIALREIKLDPASILAVISQVVADAQSDESLTIRVAPEDLAFVEKIRERTGRAAESLRRVHFEPTEGIQAGGCLLESSYGSIDATIEVRVARAWETLAERLPQPEQRTGGSGGKTGGA